MKKTLLVFLILLSMFRPCLAAKVLGHQENETPLISHLNEGNYKIQRDNEISFIYYYDNNESDKYENIQVLPTGSITIPQLGERQVLGLTNPELKKIIKSQIERVKDVDVYIHRSPNNISVLGALSDPGSYSLENIKTVYDGIAKAGGFSKTAKKTKVQLIRQRVDGTRISYTINFPKEVFKAYEEGSGIGKEIYLLQEGDMIYVPTSKPKQIGYAVLNVLNLATLGVISGVFTGIISNNVNN